MGPAGGCARRAGPYPRRMRTDRGRQRFYAAGWRKFEPLWDFVIRAKQLRQVTPLLERVLAPVTERHVADNGDQLAENSDPASGLVNL